MDENKGFAVGTKKCGLLCGAIGALAAYVSRGSVGGFQPMNVNFGIMEPLGYKVKGKRNKNAEISRRALEHLDGLISAQGGNGS